MTCTSPASTQTEPRDTVVPVGKRLDETVSAVVLHAKCVDSVGYDLNEVHGAESSVKLLSACSGVSVEGSHCERDYFPVARCLDISEEICEAFAYCRNRVVCLNVASSGLTHASPPLRSFDERFKRVG